MEATLGRGPVAKEADGHLVGAAHLDRQAHAGDDGQAAADDAVGADDALAEVGDVHRAALAPAVAGGPAVQLGEHVLDLAAFGHHVAVAAVGAGDIVVLAQRRAGAHRHGLLALGQVQEAGNLARLKVLLGRVLKAADQAHAPVHGQQLFAGQIIGWACLGFV